MTTVHIVCSNICCKERKYDNTVPQQVRCQLVEKVCFYKIERILNPYPQTPSPWEGAILLGLPPLDPVGGYAPATPFLSTIGFIDSLMPAGVLRAGLILVYCALFPSDDLSELVSSFLLSVLPVLSVPSGTSGFSTEAMSFI